jgi:hypothetical protein
MELLAATAKHAAISHLGKAIEMADKTGEGASAAATASASANQRLKLQTDLGQALMYSRGYGAEESKAAFIRARELVPAIDDATERYASAGSLGILIRQALRATCSASMASAPLRTPLTQKR